MRIVCRPSLFLRLALLTWAFGAAVGFAAGIQVTAAPNSPTAASTRFPVPESPGPLGRKEVTVEWSRTPS